jgi:uncharacterized Tic20 family protein
MDPAFPPPPGQPFGAPNPPPAPPNVRTLTMMCHLSAFAAFFVPLGNIWGPLIFWLVKKDEIPEVDLHGKESLNFQISMTIYFVVSAFLILLLIGIPMLIAASVYWIVAVILASVRANNGELYRYPLAIRFIN